MSVERRRDDDNDDYDDHDPYPDTVIENPPESPSPCDDPPDDAPRAEPKFVGASTDFVVWPDFDPYAEILKPLLDKVRKLCEEAGYAPCPVIHRDGANCPVCAGAGFALPEEVLKSLSK